MNRVEQIFKQVFSKHEKDFNKIDPNLNFESLESQSYTKPKIKMLDLDEKHVFFKEKLEKTIALNSQLENIYSKNINAPLLERLLDETLSQKMGIPFHHTYYFNHYLNELKNFNASVINKYSNDFNAIDLGVEGEKRMDKELLSFSYNNEFKFLKNVVLKFEGKSFETDFLIFSKYGIFSIEVKNIGENGNFGIRITNDGQWLKVLNNGNTVPMSDISSQVNFHTSMTEKMLHQYKKEKNVVLPEVKPAIIIANNNVMIDNQARLPVFRISQFIHELKSNPITMDENTQTDLYEWFQQFIIPAKKYEAEDFVENIEKSYQNFIQLNDNHSLLVRIVDEINLKIEQDSHLVNSLKKLVN